jgi:hypothetical protein
MAEKTPNHGLYKYTEGETDWTHSPDMQAIEERLVIRDLEESIGDYIPYSTTTFISTDTGNTYDGDGKSWQPAGRGFGTVTASTVYADKTFKDPSGKEITGEIATIDQTGGNGVEALLGQGMIVGVAPSNVHTVDPRDSGSHDAAIQDAVSQLKSGSEPGYVHIPSVPSDASHITIENTVTFDANGPDVLPMGYGFQTQNCAYIDTTIDNGDPMFELIDIRPMNAPMGNLKVSAPGQDAEFMRLKGVTEPLLQHCEVRGLGNSNPAADGAYVLDSETYNGMLFNCTYLQRGGGGENPDVSGMNAIAGRNSRGTDGPGEMHIIGFNTYADPDRPFNNGYHCDSNSSNIAFSAGRIEGSGGDGHFSVTKGAVMIGAPFELGRSENGADGVHFSGYQLIVGDGVYGSGQIDGDGIYFDPGEGHIGNVFLDAAGDDVVVTANPGGSAQVSVPSPAALNGTANYPSGASNVHVVQTSNPS